MATMSELKKKASRTIDKATPKTRTITPKSNTSSTKLTPSQVSGVAKKANRSLVKKEATPRATVAAAKSYGSAKKSPATKSQISSIANKADRSLIRSNSKTESLLKEYARKKK